MTDQASVDSASRSKTGEHYHQPSKIHCVTSLEIVYFDIEKTLVPSFSSAKLEYKMKIFDSNKAIH